MSDFLRRVLSAPAPLTLAVGLGWGIATPAVASDVLLPTFTPGTLSDFGPAEKMTEEVLEAMNERGLLFVPPSEIAARAGDMSEGCAESRDCVSVLWDRFSPSRLAVIGQISWKEGLLEANVRFYGRDDASPIEVLATTFPESDIGRFADQVAFFTEEMLLLVPEREETVVPVAAEPRVARAAPQQPAPQYAPEPAQDQREATLGQGPSRQSAGMMPKRLWQRYEDSGLTWRRFKERELVRSGSVIVEFHGSALFGSVNRIYDVRVSVLQSALVSDENPSPDFSQHGLYQQEGFSQGTAWAAGASVGYVPLWFLELGLTGGVQVGKKQLTTGWEQYVSPDETNPYDASTTTYDPNLAFMGFVEPRLRWYVVPAGPVKPYALTAASLRFFDGYGVEDNEAINYPDRAGGMGAGFVAGGGLAFDAPGGFAAFLEVPFTYMFSPAPYVLDEGTVSSKPGARENANTLLQLRAGIGFRI